MKALVKQNNVEQWHFVERVLYTEVCENHGNTTVINVNTVILLQLQY